MTTYCNKQFNLRSGVAVISLAFATAFSLPLHAQTLPTDAIVENGVAGISAIGAHNLIIRQDTSNAIISWDRFSIGDGAAVHFENGSGATLNRVRGNIGSQIDGSLSSTGSLYLVNPNGITIGVNGQIETGGHFFASTLDLSNENFVRASQGQSYILKGDGVGSVINLGKIGASGGDIVLASRIVENTGELLAPNGAVALLAGTEVLVQDRGADNGQFIVKVGGPNTRATNSGVIQATQAELRANGGNVYALAGNRDGLIAATGVAAHQGRIFLTAGDNGTVEVSSRVYARQVTENGAVKRGGEIRVSGRDVKIKGMLDVSGKAPLLLPPMRPNNTPAGDGGSVIVTGNEINLASGSIIDVSGERGGTALVGGDFQGGANPSKKYIKEDVATAQTLLVGNQAVINADGNIGDGGRIVLWADGHTDFSGRISATSLNGRGGDAEVSGKETLRFNGTSNLIGGEGAGTLLLDPYNLTIVAGSGGDVTSSSTVSTLGADTLTSLLQDQNVTVQTGGVVGDGSPDEGNITVNAAINWGMPVYGPQPTSLIMKAHNNIIVNENIEGLYPESTITLRADSDNTGVGTVVYGPGVTVSASGGVSIYYNPIGGYSVPEDFEATSYMLVHNIDDLQRIGDLTHGNLAGSYALTRDIDASITANPASHFEPEGFKPIGTQAAPFTGAFDGQGHVIKGLTINRPLTDDVGLFGATNDVNIFNLGLEGGAISGRDNVGALVGYMQGDTSIANVSASINVNGRNQVGGLIGGSEASNKISEAYASGNVIASGDNVGGFIGSSAYAVIHNAYATGAVIGNNIVGGFSGNSIARDGYYEEGNSIHQIYATGRITANGDEVGGLFGRLSGSEEGEAYVSGFWDIDTTGQLEGKTGTGATILGSGIYSSTNSVNAFSKDTYENFEFTLSEPWTMIEGHTRPMLRMELDVIGNRGDGNYTISNAHQLQLMTVHAKEGRTLDATYMLANNIDLNSALNNNSDIWRTVFTKDVDDSYGFAFIGREGAQFHGTLDGNGRTINGLVINKPSYEAVGLIGYASDKATIKNIGLVGGTVYGRNEVGSLVGINRGVIANAYSQVDVRGEDWVGGLIGRTTGPAIVNTAYASGNVIGAGQYVGGFAGQSNSIITNAYASGNVIGNAFTGGFAGLNGGTIINVYATGAVIGDDDAGGLLGSNTGEIDHSFWNTDTKTVGIGDGFGNVTGMTLSQFQNTTYFMKTASEWDFANIWAPPGSGFSAELYALSKVIRIHAGNAVTATYGSSSGAWIGGVPGGIVYGSNLNITGETNYGSPAAFTAYPTLNYGGLMGSDLIAQINGLNESGANGYRFIYTASAEITPASPTPPPPPAPQVASLNAHECHIINKNAEVGLIDEGINISAMSTLVGGDSENEPVAVLFGAPTQLINLNCNPDFFD